MTMNTRMSTPGFSNAACVAAASPSTASSHQQTNANASMTGTAMNGVKRRANGAVMRRARSGFATTARRRIRSIGSAFFNSGSPPSASRSRPSGRSFSSSSVSTSPAVTARPTLAAASAAICSVVRLPSTPCMIA